MDPKKKLQTPEGNKSQQLVSQCFGFVTRVKICVEANSQDANLFVHVSDDQQHGAVQVGHVPVERL